MFTIILPLPRQISGNELAKKFAQAANMQQYPGEQWKHETFVNKMEWHKDSMDPVVVKETLVVCPTVLTRRKRFFFFGPIVENWEDANNLAIKLVLNPQKEYAQQVKVTVIYSRIYYCPIVFDDSGTRLEADDPADQVFATMRPKVEKFLRDLSESFSDQEQML